MWSYKKYFWDETRGSRQLFAILYTRLNFLMRLGIEFLYKSKNGFLRVSVRQAVYLKSDYGEPNGAMKPKKSAVSLSEEGFLYG